MITPEDCTASSGLSEAEVLAISEHERMPDVQAPLDLPMHAFLFRRKRIVQ